MDPVRVVESVLFSSKPLKISEIAGTTQLTESEIRGAVKKLAKEYRDRSSAIEIVKIGPKYSMQLRKEFTECARPFTEKEVPDDVLKIAAMIAYHQPVLQSALAKVLGSEVYKDVEKLRSMGLVKAKKRGQTLQLTTTQRFAEYFGIEGSTREDIKRWMESQLKS
ncbi:MAG: SMC-Scp complex subunit ScpB [Methanomassiliicoccales archaeon]|nr:SMC-Scp complex subunit ScpB [Methanomassiliicoccales archaeon]